MTSVSVALPLRVVARACTVMVTATTLVLVALPNPVAACTTAAYPTVAQIRAAGGLVIHARLEEVSEPGPAIEEYRLTVLEVLQGEAPNELVLRDLETTACGRPLPASVGQKFVLALDVRPISTLTDPVWVFDADGRVVESTVAGGKDVTDDPLRWLGTEAETILGLFRMPDTASVAPGRSPSPRVSALAIGASGVLGLIVGVLVFRRPRRAGSE